MMLRVWGVFKVVGAVLKVVMLYTLPTAVLLTLLFFLSNMIALQKAHIQVYDNTHAKLVREHEAYIAFSQVVHETNKWARQAETLRDLLIQERGTANKLRQQLYFIEHDLYTFMTILEAVDPAVLQEVLERLGKAPPGPPGPCEPPDEVFPDLRLVPTSG